MHYLYFIASEDVRRMKIGITNNIFQRLEALTAHSPCMLYVYDFVECNNEKEARAEEQRLHRILQRFKHHGEWFESTEELRSAIDCYKMGRPIPNLNRLENKFCKCGAKLYDLQDFCHGCLDEPTVVHARPEWAMQELLDSIPDYRPGIDGPCGNQMNKGVTSSKPWSPPEK